MSGARASDGAAPGPVFIIGGSRTGSEMLKTMLCESPEQDFVDELFLLCPRWLHPDLDSMIRRNVGSLDGPGALDRLLDFLYSGKPYGWFWEHAETQLDRDLLREHLRDRPLDLPVLFDAVMRTHAGMRGKTRLGAKFPTHFSATDRLLEWYPDCRLLHTTREPKAVYASQGAKYIAPGDSAAARGYMRFKQFVHINLQVSWTARLHRALQGRENYRLVRYEDTVRDPAGSLREICRFLDLEYRDEMLAPKRYGSSFGKVAGARGIDSASLERWRHEISPATAWLMDVLHPVARRRLGYGAPAPGPGVSSAR